MSGRIEVPPSVGIVKSCNPRNFPAFISPSVDDNGDAAEVRHWSQRLSRQKEVVRPLIKSPLDHWYKNVDPIRIKALKRFFYFKN